VVAGASFDWEDGWGVDVGVGVDDRGYVDGDRRVG
jgi:hypothetical protein